MLPELQKPSGTRRLVTSPAASNQSSHGGVQLEGVRHLAQLLAHPAQRAQRQPTALLVVQLPGWPLQRLQQAADLSVRPPDCRPCLARCRMQKTEVWRAVLGWQQQMLQQAAS